MLCDYALLMCSLVGFDTMPVQDVFFVSSDTMHGMTIYGWVRCDIWFRFQLCPKRELICVSGFIFKFVVLSG